MTTILNIVLILALAMIPLYILYYELQHRPPARIDQWFNIHNHDYDK